MKTLDFPRQFNHRHGPVRNVNDIVREELTFGQKAADRIARVMGSWEFLIIQSLILALWIILNVVAWSKHWDPYPFILMNLFLSTQAAYTAPVILMSQNRQSLRDRLEAHNDYLINQKTEEEVRVILDHLAAQDRALGRIHRILLDPRAQSDRVSGN